jgi:DUF971 family protein
MPQSRSYKPVPTAITLHQQSRILEIYSWGYLYDLGKRLDRYWMDYLDALKQAGYQRRSVAS